MIPLGRISPSFSLSWFYSSVSSCHFYPIYLPSYFPPGHNRGKGMIDLQPVSLQNKEYSPALFQLSSYASGMWGLNCMSHQAMLESSLSFFDYHLLKFMAKIIFLFPCLVAAHECSLVLFLTFFFVVFTIFASSAVFTR